MSDSSGSGGGDKAGRDPGSVDGTGVNGGGGDRPGPDRVGLDGGGAQTGEDRIGVGVDGPVATVWLDHPSKLNVLDGQAWEALAHVFDRLGQDDQVRCVVLRGRGGRAFSAGSDIGRFPEQRRTPDDVLAYSGKIHRALEAVRHSVQPTVALVEGLCVGGGLEIAACCDIRVAGASSRFGAPINRLGLTMAFEELDPLVRLLGPGPVLDILLTGDLLDAGDGAHPGAGESDLRG